MPLCSRISYLYFGIQVAKHRRHSLQPCKFLTDKIAHWTIDRVYGYFAGQERIIEVMTLIKIAREIVKFIGTSLFKRAL